MVRLAGRQETRSVKDGGGVVVNLRWHLDRS